MKTTMITEKESRKRKILLVLPLLVLPFTTLLFWVAGGGKAEAGKLENTKTQGLNTKVPDAKLKNDSALNKLSYYDRAASDSAKLRQLMKADPYYNEHLLSDTAVNKMSLTGDTSTLTREPASSETRQDPAELEKKLNKKLRKLQATIDQPADIGQVTNIGTDTSRKTEFKYANNELAREDPELKQMNDVLERILEIQHPERFRQKAGPDTTSTKSVRFNAIPALIDGKQTITEGTVVRLRLQDSVTISGQFIPKGQLLFGTGRLYNQRMALDIKLIRMGNMIIPADLTVFDMTDGLEGISVPEAITDDAVRTGAVNGVQNMEFMSLDPSLNAQLAGAGINAAKGLFKKKVKRIKARLNDGHLLLLRDNAKLRAMGH